MNYLEKSLFLYALWLFLCSNTNALFHYSYSHAWEQGLIVCLRLWLTLSCPGTGRTIVKIGHSNLRPGSKELCKSLAVLQDWWTLITAVLKYEFLCNFNTFKLCDKYTFHLLSTRKLWKYHFRYSNYMNYSNCNAWWSN